MLVTIDDLITTEELASMRAMLAQATWESGLASAGPQAALAKNNWQLPEQAKQMPALRQIVLAALQRCPLFFAAALPLKVLPPFFNRYGETANYYHAHADNAMRLMPGQTGQAAQASQYLRADISATLFLSEPDEYEGGELNIEDTFGTHGVKLKAGSLVLYPSSSIHAVMPVTKGERLASFMFIQSMVRDTGQRRLLYEMDMSLLALREEIGEHDAVMRLTGSYHNLLRRWAET